MNVMDQTITGAASGETVLFLNGTEGFTISGKRTEDQPIHISLSCPGSSYPLKQIGVSNLFFSYIH